MANERLDGGWMLVHSLGQHSHGGAWYFVPSNARIPLPARSLHFEPTPSRGGVSCARSMIITILVTHNPDSERDGQSR